jgi:hypothetical protein
MGSETRDGDISVVLMDGTAVGVQRRSAESENMQWSAWWPSAVLKASLRL